MNTLGKIQTLWLEVNRLRSRASALYPLLSRTSAIKVYTKVMARLKTAESCLSLSHAPWSSGRDTGLWIEGSWVRILPRPCRNIIGKDIYHDFPWLALCHCDWVWYEAHKMSKWPK